MKEHESFLKMIGLDDEVESRVESTDELNAFETPSEGPDIGDSYDSFLAQLDEQEPTLKEEAHYKTEVENIETEEFTDPEEAWEEEAITSEVGVEDTSPESYEDEDSLMDEPTRPTDYNHQTSVYSPDEAEHLTENVKEQLSPEDRLLDGLEAAEESRATDIFARSFRSDERSTNAAGISDDVWEEPSEPQEISAQLDTDEGSWHKTAVANEDARQTNPSRQTQAFNYEKAKSSRLHLIEGLTHTSEVNLDLLPLSFGRDPKNNVVLDDSNVSRFHAEIRDIEGRMTLVDLGSTNGVKVNGALVSEQALQDHDLLQIGETIFEFLNEGSEPKDMSAARETYVGHTEQRAKTFKFSFNKKNKIRILAAGLFIFGGLLFALQKFNLAEKADTAGKAVVLSRANTALDEFKTQLEIQYDRPIAELSDEEIQQNFLKEIESFSLLPDSLKSELKTLPPSVLRIFLQKPEVLKTFVESGGNEESVRAAVRSQLSEYMRAGQFEDAYSLTELLLKIEPENQELKDLYADLKSKLSVIETPDVDDISQEDQEKFFTYMSNFQKQADDLIEQGEYEAARNFAEIVKEKTLELVRKQPAFGILAGSAISEWTSKVAFLDKKIAERSERKEEINEMFQIGDDKIELIKSDMNAGRVYEASLAVQEFLQSYPDHPRAAEVRTYGEEIQQAISISFDSMNSKIETYVRTENYKVAWDSLYRFLDLMPGHNAAMKLRETLLDQTRMRASQYYNQARVFEFEADDLIAAEQYYKKVLETADPRGELAQKAERRYADVRRKTIQ